ncbi:MAG: hypothetical protein WC471_00085 [Candidatus Woesearchaeota archaeon]
MATKKKAVKAVKRTVKRKALVEDKPELLYMGINNPIEIRRTVLECARDMVHFLQMFEKFRLIREEKKEAIRILKKEMKDLSTLMNKLKLIMPKASVRTEVHKEEVVKEAKEAREGKPKAFEMPKQEMPDLTVDDIDALESELKEIEEKLNFL